MQDASLFMFIDTAICIVAMLLMLALPFLFPEFSLTRAWTRLRRHLPGGRVMDTPPRKRVSAHPR